MKKICFVTTLPTTLRGFVLKLAAYLNETGEYEISFICNPDEGFAESLPAYIHFLPVKMKRGISLDGFTAINEMVALFKRERFDIVQYSTPNAALYASIAASIAKVPVRLYCQWGIRYMGFEKGFNRKIFKTTEKITCNHSTFVEPESNGLRNFAIKEKLYKPEKSKIIWNGSASGIDLCKFDIAKKQIWRDEIRSQLSIGEDCFVFLFAGRLTKDKGLNELLAAFLSIENYYPMARLIVCGEMDDERSLNEDYSQALRDPRVIFTGNVSCIEKYYAAADVFVAPSYREGFGLVVIEAEAMGLPAIVSDVPGQIDTIINNKTGLSCEVQNSESLKKALEWMLTHSEQRIQMGTAACKYARENYEQVVLFKKIKEQRDFLILNSNAQKKEQK